MNWLSLLIGILLGWLIEWLIDIFYWRRRRARTEDSARTLRAQLASTQTDVQYLQAQVAQRQGLESQLAACETGRAQQASELQRLGVELHALRAEGETRRKPAEAPPAVERAGVGGPDLAKPTKGAPVAVALGAEQVEPSVSEQAAVATALAAEQAEHVTLSAVQGAEGVAPSVSGQADGAVAAVDLQAQGVAASVAQRAEAVAPSVGARAELAAVVVGEPAEGSATSIAPRAGDAVPPLAETILAAGGASGEPQAEDDLAVIEGIGPKISEVLKDAGLRTFAQLADTPVERLRAILAQAGPRFALANPDTWPQQARLAAARAWDELKALQDELRGGLKRS